MWGWRALAVAVLTPLVAACGLPSAPGISSGKVGVVAAENFWGSIAAQVGGDRVHVTSIITNPGTDPHSYEATPADARAIAGSRLLIVNGAGYGSWAAKLASASPVPRRLLLDAGKVNGVKDGANPHLWYSAAFVGTVIDRITADLETLDPAGATYDDQQGAEYQDTGLKDYHDTIGAIRQKYSGTAVGASESIVAYVAESTGLALITPAGYLKAISEGSDPSAADKATVDQQLKRRQIKVDVFNSQNSTPDVQTVVGRARAAGIPIVPITETLAPASVSFQDWQTRELEALLAALGG
jgi:zinc/manganese transport system substrate-binding protein